MEYEAKQAEVYKNDAYVNKQVIDANHSQAASLNYLKTIIQVHDVVEA